MEGVEQDVSQLASTNGNWLGDKRAGTGPIVDLGVNGHV